MFLTVQDFIEAKQDADAQAEEEPLSVTKKPFAFKLILGDQGVRATALVGLFTLMFGLYWYEHHPHNTSPALPAKAYSYAMTQAPQITKNLRHLLLRMITIRCKLMGSFKKSRC